MAPAPMVVVVDANVLFPLTLRDIMREQASAMEREECMAIRRQVGAAAHRSAANIAAARNNTMAPT